MAERILVVDDDEFMRSSLQLELEAAGFTVAAAKDGMEAIERSREQHFDLIVCDVRMPGIDGLDTLKTIKEVQPMARNMIITGYASPDAPVTALKMKVDDYLLKPFSSEEFLQSVRNALKEYRQSSLKQRSPLRFKDSLLTIISAILFESRFSFLVGHSERVARLVLKIGRKLGFSSQRLQSLYLAAQLHDIGHIELPPSILEKREFDKDDLAVVRNHPVIARDMLSPFSELSEISTVIFHHHEKWNGSGYPKGLGGDQIPLESQIIGLAEMYDSLVSERPHRKRKSPEEALELMEKESGISFDGELINILKEVSQRGDYQEIQPIPSAPDYPERALSLINLADLYRGMGNFDVALKAYTIAGELLSSEETPEMLIRVQLGRMLINNAQGQTKEALEIGLSARQLAKEKSLHYLEAQLALEIAVIKLKCGDNEGIPELILQAHETFTVWEAAYQRCEAAFLLSVYYSGKDDSLPSFTSFFSDFLRCTESGRFHEILRSRSDLAVGPVRCALEHDIELDAVKKLFKDHDGAPLEIVERLMDFDNTSLRLKSLDIIAGIDDNRARAILSKTHLDSDRLIREKSSLLLKSSRLSPVTPLPQIFFFGKFRVLIGDRLIEDEVWPTRKMRSLFACLASRRGEIRNEENLMELFWPQGDEKARHSLHNCISQIRKALAPFIGEDSRKLILRKRDGYTFNKDAYCWIDLEEFEAHMLRGKSLADSSRWEEALLELQKAERLYTGEFLENSYEDWSGDLRFKSSARFVELLRILGTYFFDKKKYEVSADYWKKILTHDNCMEDAYLGLMICHTAQGNTNEAIRVYHECARTLKHELELLPPASIVETYLRLVDGKPVELKLQ
ncbi:MAG: HD domain-containing phosphohydrolase [Vulcanimicrobiota bacterium]